MSMEKRTISLISLRNSGEIVQKDAVTTTGPISAQDDGQVTRSTAAASHPKSRMWLASRRFPTPGLEDAYSLATSILYLSGNTDSDLSETSLDADIPSYPGSPRSYDYSTITSSSSQVDKSDSQLQITCNFLQEDHAFIEAAEIGDDKLLEDLLRRGNADIQQLDLLGRSALHLAVCSGNERAIRLLLQAGITVNLKDNVGMSPLSLCLMRNQSLPIAKLLFNYGACIMPRNGPADTGLFLQFVSVCTPTSDDETILEMLVNKGALVNDPGAPGGRQALHIAAMGNNVPLINKLVSLGANLYTKNHRGETPLEFARIFKCKEAVARLEELEELLCVSSETTVTVGTLGDIASDEYRVIL